MSGLINCRIEMEFIFHNDLHVFRAGRGMGNDSLKAKIIQ